MKAEDLAYALWGNNIVIGPHIRRQLAFLADIVPEEMLGRRLDDLGCGDGKVTVLLESVFCPVYLRGFDVNRGLVKRAEKRGIDAQTIDLERQVPRGELAVLWGVLHHLRNFEECLKKVVQNYPLVFIREPVRTGWNPLELGKPLLRKELVQLIGRCVPGGAIHHCENSIMVFYANPVYLELEKVTQKDRVLSGADQ